MFFLLPPKEEARFVFAVFAREAKRRSKLPGGWKFTEYMFRTLFQGIAAVATLLRNDTIKLKYAPGGIAALRIYVFVKNLNVETEKHHVAVFHDVVLALGTDFAQFLGFYVTAAV